MPISFNRIEVAVDTAYEQFSTLRSTLRAGAQQADNLKPRESSGGSDLECGIEPETSTEE